MIGEILGPDVLIVVGVIVVLFGGSQIPRLARSLGQAKGEFAKGLTDDANTDPLDRGGNRRRRD
jgi:sec-independent protein translocase protein TatA